MIQLKSSQAYRDQHQMIAGSLTYFTITLLDDGHKSVAHKLWPGTVTAGSSNNIKAGVEYTVTNVGTNGSGDVDWTAVGHVDGSVMGTTVKVGDKFVAAASGKNPGDDIVFNPNAGAIVSYSSNEEALAYIIKLIATRATIVNIGNANEAGKGAGASKFRCLVENNGITKEELLKELNTQANSVRTTKLADTATTVFNVEDFVL